MPTTDPDQFLNTDQAATLLGMSASYVRKLRLVGGGPAFSTLGSGGRADGVRYRRGALLAWAESRSARSTTERDAMVSA
ncbi:helix-turn-helix domain-containing protein [Brevundimonas sp.]|uniref:helix-turn-helix transcriptional regulator n=1 Tax=Brevundimonas sp. TaxID=1871086 RepID=UPI001A1C6A10|nr:helix-turn-helix domain-containing protein [Brevundimonas sp.]